MANPAYRAFTVVKREGKDDYWLNLGVAFAHDDGEGLKFTASPQASGTQGRDRSKVTSAHREVV